MRNLTKLFYLIFLFSTINANSQNYLISFAGTGAASIVSAVKVENLTKNTSLTLNEGEQLRLTSPTGITDVQKIQSSGLKIYPNPMNESSIIEFLPSSEGDGNISVIDMMGKPVAHLRNYLENSVQRYRISGLKTGMYLINVEGKNYQMSGKFISNGTSEGAERIEKINIADRTVDKKIKEEGSKGTLLTIDMSYSQGDRLRFTGSSGIYNTVITDIPASSKTITFNFIECTDGDNNNYPAIEIGTQVWMGENLKTTKYLNGDLIGTTTPANLNIFYETGSKYQWAYSGNEANAATYGRLYTWFAATDSRNLCPAGWRLPTGAEFLALYNYLFQNGYGYTGVGWQIAKSLTATSGWTINSVAGSPGNDPASNNSSGFAALPGGFRADYGWYAGIGSNTYLWCSTESSGFGDSFVLYSDQQGSSTGSNNKKWGQSVRCIKN